MDLSVTSMEKENGTEKEEDKRQKQKKKSWKRKIMEKVKSRERGGKGWKKG